MAIAQCNTNLGNLGYGDCPLQMGEIRRLLFTSYLKEDGTENYISQSNAATLANWTTLFDKWSWRSVSTVNDVMTKVVPTQLLFGVAVEQGDPEAFDENGYFKKVADGTYDIMATIYDPQPDYINSLRALEDSDLSVYFGDDDNRIWGRSVSTNLYPVKIQNLSVPNFNLATRENPSTVIIKFRLEIPAQMNTLTGITVTDGTMTSDTNFFSLNDSTQTVSSPAVTGCQLVIVDDRYGNEVTGITYDEIKFRQSDSLSTVESLAGAGSLTESPNGTYVINEASLLTSGKTYYVEISHSGYDVAVANCVVP